MKKEYLKVEMEFRMTNEEDILSTSLTLADFQELGEDQVSFDLIFD